jgi:hypothetical protein
MKQFYVLASIVLIFLFSSAVRALEVELSLATALMPSEKQAFQVAQQLGKEIVLGNNEDAKAEAFLNCPEDNQPRFEITYIQLSTAWLFKAASSNDKQYRARVNYKLMCAHGGRGVDR